MAHYQVFMNTTVSSWVTVEANDPEEACEAALEAAPYAPGFANYEFGEWEIDGEPEEQES